MLTYLLNETQRKHIEYYLKHSPSMMPPYTRCLRTKAKQLDLEQMQYDLNLLKTLRDLQVRQGRPPKALSELKYRLLNKI